MKPWVRFVTVGMLAIMAMLFCQWFRHSGGGNPPPETMLPTESSADSGVSAAAPEASATRFSEVTQSKPVPPTAVTFEDELALIHLKLHQWLEAKKNGTEESETQTMVELQAMLSDTNAAAIIQSLSAEELDTPFGFEGISHWMNADPVQASNWFAARPGTTQDQTGAIAQGWAADAAGLQNYVAQLPDSTWKQSFLQEAGSQLSARDPAAAAQLALQMPPGNDRTSLLQSVACNWIASDPNAALDWINSQSDSSVREQLVASAAQSYAITDPAQAAAWLASSVKSDDLVKDSVVNITQTWVTKDPAAAAKWASQLPDGDTRNTALDLVTKYWQQTDPTAANTWIQGLSGMQSGSSGNSAGL
jgi:hypothetical protein